jgi:hypothetical protein
MSLSRMSALALAATLAALSLLPSSAAAQRVRPTARVGLEAGGAKVIEFQYDNGTTPTMTAGGGLLLSGGVLANLMAQGAHAVDAQLNVGLKYRTIPPANNQDVTWLRFPVEGLLFYRAPSGFRIGAGGTVHLANKISSSGAVLNDKVEFNNTPGVIAQAEYVIQDQYSIDLRYTALKYQAKGSTQKMDASSIGIGASWFFGKASVTGSAR